MARQADLSIEKKYIEMALEQIGRDRNIPLRKRSKRFCLIKNKRHYPPKYVLSRAHYHKVGEERRFFKGGDQTNNLLGDLGYDIKVCREHPHCQNWIIENSS